MVLCKEDFDHNVYLY